VDQVTIETPEQIVNCDVHWNEPLDLIREMNVSAMPVKEIVKWRMNYQDQRAAYRSEVMFFKCHANLFECFLMNV
jgi:hypothetical protein